MKAENDIYVSVISELDRENERNKKRFIEADFYGGNDLQYVSAASKVARTLYARCGRETAKIRLFDPVEKRR